LYLLEVGACDLQSGLLFTYTIFCFIAPRMDLIIMSGCVPYFWHPLSPLRISSFRTFCLQTKFNISSRRIQTLSYFAADAEKRAARWRCSLLLATYVYLCCFLQAWRFIAQTARLSQNANALCERAEISEIALSVATSKRHRRFSLLLFVLLSVLHFSCVFCMQIERL
jgi:hypothetical protein